MIKHLGSGGNYQEINQLKSLARKWIEKETGQTGLFTDKKSKDHDLTPLGKYQYRGIRYFLAYEVINRLLRQLGLGRLDRLLLDLVLVRIIEPSSKLKSLELLEKYFGLRYHRSTVYRHLSQLVLLKEKVERKTILYAQKHLGFNFKVVFYDVTTLYFETDKTDELRRCGFSKDHKFNQPQILLGLVVDSNGFPLCYEIFEGKKFEGHTLLPVIKRLKEKYQIKSLTVVADAAMLSLDNIKELLDYQLSYIVGGRVANLSLSLIKTISANLNRKTGASLRIITKHGLLICDFSPVRYRKDKHEMDKQIKKAQDFIHHPPQDQKKPKIKFLKTTGKTKYSLNQELIDKTKLILGIKGYYSNLKDTSNREIIKQYHNLWKVEKAFRISKSDLQTRPIYHFKAQTIQGHILICFMALAVSKHLELITEQSLQINLGLLKEVTDARMFNTITKTEVLVRSLIPEKLKPLLKTLGLSY